MKLTLKLALFCLILFSAQLIYAQTDADTLLYDDDEKIVKPEADGIYKVGVKMGFQINTLTGSEADRAKISYGLNGGMYVKRKLGKQTALQAELTGSFRGSNFTQNNIIDTQYTSIRLLYIDVPLMIMYMPFKGSTNTRLLLGPYCSILVNSTLYLNSNSLPEGAKPNITNNDYGIAAAYQYNTPFVGFQFMCKAGLANINKGIYANNNYNGKNLNNFVFEINLIF